MTSEPIAAELNAIINGALESGASTYSPTLDVLGVPDVKEAEIIAQGEVERLEDGDVHRRPDGRSVRLFFGHRRRLRRILGDVLTTAADLDGDDTRRLLTVLADLDDEALRRSAIEVGAMTTDERIDLVDRLIEMEDLA